MIEQRSRFVRRWYSVEGRAGGRGVEERGGREVRVWVGGVKGGEWRESGVKGVGGG